ncbi:MAG TPA: ATP-binding protein [Gemmatimonadaceae bacterium]|nr:ATP-binding protein [Gemmatimonadaceae bacterium]
MASTRTNLTVGFVVAMVAVTATLALTVWTVRNASIYRDVARYAATEADVASTLIRDAGEAAQSVIVGPDTVSEALLITPRLRALLDAFPDYVVVLDKLGTPLYQSTAVRRLSSDEADSLVAKVQVLPNDSAGVAQLPNVEEVVLFSRAVVGGAESTGRVIVGVPTSRVTVLPREYRIVLFFIAPIIIALAGWRVWAVSGLTAQRIDTINKNVAAITDGRSLHRRLNIENAGQEFQQLIGTLNAMIARLETSFLGLRRFTADASHELKTPLAVLRADVERAMSDPVSASERMIALEEALQETTRMADLVESLLTLARADEGRFDIHREPIALKPLVQDIYETALILGEGAGVSVNFPFTADVTVMGDPTRLRQLFLNLVTNAIKYTPAGGKVELGLGVHPDNVTFAVRDTGIGIAAADVPHIFERFWRADRARSRLSERGGFGLGLAISQWIAQAHGGTLTASSRLGRGSLFTVTLPLPPQPPNDNGAA